MHGCAPFENVTFAIATTDMGHEGPGPDFGDDPQLQDRFRPSRRACDGRGRQGDRRGLLRQASRARLFHWLLRRRARGLDVRAALSEPISTGSPQAPRLSTSRSRTRSITPGTPARTPGPDGKPIIVAADLPILHRAALKACHAEDGVIADPRRCAFDPVAALCTAGQDADCLTAEQVEAARKIYDGPRTADGLALTIGGPQPGSELSWAGVYVPKPGSDDIFSNVIAGGTISFLAFEPNPPKTFGLERPRLRPRDLRAAEADARALRCDQSRPLGLLRPRRAARSSGTDGPTRTSRR